MKNWLFFLLLVPAFLAAQKPITLEDIWSKNAFGAKGVPGFQFSKDGASFTRLVDGAIEKFDLKTGQSLGKIFEKTTVEAGAATGWEGKFDSYQFSADEQKVLLATATEPIYRWSSKSQFFVFDFQKKELTKLHDGAPQRDATFSPDGSKVAFLSENDLFYRDLATDQVIRATIDGKENAIINGAGDWVYEEEFELVRAFEWSADGQILAWLRFDEREVPEFRMEYFRGAAYPEPTTFKYPKVSERNSMVTAWMHDLRTKKNIFVETLNTEEDYLPRIAWTAPTAQIPSGELVVTRLNRLQNKLELLAADPATGQCNLLLEETSPTYVELTEPIFLKNGSGFLWQSEKSGFRQLYFYKTGSQKGKALTSGKFEVTKFYGLDERTGELFFQAASKNAAQREIFRTDLGGKKPKMIAGATPGWHDATFGPTFDFFQHSFSTINAPTVFEICDRSGKTIRTIENNAVLAGKQLDFGTQPITFFTFKNSKKDVLNGWMLKPPASKMGGKKPCLMFVYGGPGSQQVTDQWKGANYWWFQHLAQKGFVVACVDNRGTGGRGEQFKKMTYKQLGKLETEDQIDAAKWLGQQPFIDPARIGIFGWSYGGYMASSCLFKGEKTFKAAIAVAPVTNWKWYDSAYTERFMQTLKENAAGYEDNSPINFAEKMEGDFLLVHGEADDNVHFQHTAELANRLISAGKKFETHVYPNRNHGIGGQGARLHLYSKMTDFLIRKL